MQVENVTVECKGCGRTFRRTSDRKRHKCVAERAKPVKEQRDALQCSKCQKWFCSRGGLAVHKCIESRELLTETPVKDENSALLSPSGLRRASDQIWQWTDRTGCVCVCLAGRVDMSCALKPTRLPVECSWARLRAMFRVRD